MSRNTKVILAVISGLIVVGGCISLAAILFFQNSARSLSRTVVSDPTAVAAVSAEIATFAVPAGYEETGMNLLGLYRGVILSQSGADQNRHMILLFGVPNISEQEQAQFENLLKQRMDQASSDIQWEAPTTRPVQIRSQQVEMVTRKGTNQNGEAYQMESVVFQGVNGSVILLIAGPQQGWDQEIFDKFIHSIR